MTEVSFLGELLLITYMKLFKATMQPSSINANKRALKNDLMSVGLLEASSVGLHGGESWFPSLF